MTRPVRAFLSIGEVLGELRPEFPDVTISKIRFLESEGLISPDRTPAGYRKFSRDDVDRLRFVLAAQRDRYLPLRVIKDHLDALDQGREPPDMPGGAPAPRPQAGDGPADPASLGPDVDGPRLTRSQLLAATGLSAEQLIELETYGLLAARSGRYDQTALSIAQIVAELARYGIGPRHLRPFRTAAEREIGLFEQVVAPLARQRAPDARGRAEETIRELASLSIRLHAALVKSGLRSALGG